MEPRSSVARVIAERFHVLSPLGGGGTMLGRDSRSGDTVTLKPFPGTSVSDSARAAAIRHGEVGPLDVCVDGEHVWLIRPYVRGVPLSERLGRLTLTSCAALATGLLQALGELHARGLTHLSVHPGNVLVNPDGPIRTAVLVDSAAALLRPTRSTRFGAPEQTSMLEGQAGTSPATDLYAAGLILYESLAGIGPHDGRGGAGDIGELLRRRLTDDPASLREQRPQVPADLEREVRRLIALHPEDRPASAAESLSALLGAFHVSASLAGRSVELDQLLHHDRGLLLLTGPAGSGKTRLLDELAGRAERWILSGRGRETPTAPLLALDELAEGIALRAAREPDFSARVSALGSAASVMLPSLRGEFPPSGEPDSRAVAALLSGLGEPVVLVVDDGEWADQATIEVLRLLDGRPGVGVIAAACSLAEDHPLMQVGDAEHVALGKLADPEIAAIAPGTELLAQGNPARAMIARDCLRIAGRDVHGSDDLMARRLELIQPDLRRTLAAAAVLGRQFDPDVLTKLVGAHAPQGMLAAESDGLLEGPAFRDEMVRAAILDSLGSDERARLHRRAADVLRGRTYERADHMLRGGQRSVEVVEQARAAGEAARARGALDIAEHYLRAARKQVLDVAPGLALPVIEGLAAVLDARGRPDLATEQLETAARLARDPEAQVRIAGALAALSTNGVGPSATPPASARSSRVRGLIRRPQRAERGATIGVEQVAVSIRRPTPIVPPAAAAGGPLGGLLECGRRVAEARTRQSATVAAQEMAEALLGCERAILLEVSGEPGAEVVGPPPPDCDESLARVSRALARRAASTRAASRPPLRGLDGDVVAGARATDAVCVPVLVRGAVRGALYFSSCGDTRLAGHVAALAGAAFENVEVLAELETLSRSLEERVEQRTAQLGQTNRQLDVSLERLTEAFERERSTAAQLKHQAFHDPLTDLANRALFVNRVEHALELTARRGGELAVLFVDLDDFKTVNDSLGHSIGDELLIDVAGRLREVLRSADTAARLGGDEFAILIEDVSAREGASRTAERVLAAISQPFTLAGKEVMVRASVGIALRGEDSPEVEELLRNADVAMYIAKSTGKHRYEIFEQRMHEQVVRRLELKGDLERAIELQEFAVHYQPIVDLHSGAITGMEALVRWEHRLRGLVPPLDFVPLAEETGLIREIGDWVLRAACEQVRGWQRAPRHAGQRLTVGVNLSARELHEPALVESVSSALAASELSPRDLTLEITESVLMHDTDATIVRLGELRELGVKLAIDDFGTGYSSLGYLKRFPVDVLKIDKTFVDDVASSREEAAVAAAIVTLSETLHLETVAEGIEHPEQLAALRGLGCDFGQGYLFSRPVPGGDMGALLDGSRVLEPSL